MNLIIITGEIGVGKSTVCSKTSQLARRNQLSCGGIITTKNSVYGLETENLLNGEKETLACLEKRDGWLNLGKYNFNPAGIEFGLSAIFQGASSDIIFVDELGILELNGQGFAASIDFLNNGTYQSAITVIRQFLLPSYLSLFSIKPRVFEVSANNRNEIPNLLFLYIVSEL
jgi:nucleoside-triphosphatase THEP1